MDTYRIIGRIVDRKEGFGIPGLRIEAWDKDLLFDDLLGFAITDEEGNFQISFDKSSFRDFIFFDRKPDLYFKIFRKTELIKNTKNNILWNVDRRDIPITIGVEATDEESKQHSQGTIRPDPAVTRISTVLTSLTGQIETVSSEDHKKLAALQEDIASALLYQDPQTVVSQDFIFERSDLYSAGNLSPERLSKINEAAAKAVKEKKVIKKLVYLRTIPIQTTQIPGSISPAANGAKVTTEGPFLDLSGRLKYFDFVNIEELIPLYIKGWSEPAILFRAAFKKPLFVLGNSVPVEITKNYKVIPNSVWINSKIFDPASPMGYFCGLRVRSGSITLSAEPQVVNGKLTVSGTTNVQCQLELEMKSFVADATSPFGIDGREAVVIPPSSFTFSFRGNTKKIMEISPSMWNVVSHEANFKYDNFQNCNYLSFINQMIIPLSVDNKVFSGKCKSTLCRIEGKAEIKNSWWAIPAAKINITMPPEAEGNGALLIHCDPGLSASQVNAENKEITLTEPFIMAEPGMIGMIDLKSDGLGARQEFELWQDEINRFGTTMEWQFLKNAPYSFFSSAAGNEIVAGLTNCKMNIDRPVKVDGTPVAVDSKNSLFTLIGGKTYRGVILFDNDVLWDHTLPGEKIPEVVPFALALHNALFTVSPPNGVMLFGGCSPDFKVVTKGSLFLAFGLFSYLPTLPDPYAANLGLLGSQFGERIFRGKESPVQERQIWLWLIGLVKWEKRVEDDDKVGVSFHFAVLNAPVVVETVNKDPKKKKQNVSEGQQVLAAGNTVFDEWKKQAVHAFPGNESIATKAMSLQTHETVAVNPLNMPGVFALLDVSSKANQMGVAMIYFGRIQTGMLKTRTDWQSWSEIANEAGMMMFPIQVEGLDVKTRGFFAQSFTVPQIAWEPVLNLTAPQYTQGAKFQDPLDPSKMITASAPFDPPAGFNYYQNDGFPTRIGNLSSYPVTLSPIPLAKYLVEMYHDKKDRKTYALFNLPFGMVALTILDSSVSGKTKPSIEEIKPVFDNYIIGGIQIELTAGASVNLGEDNLFEGFTYQLHNINNPDGTDAEASTLAHSPDVIFNGEFNALPDLPLGRPAVPLERIGLSGYGASTFSDWLNKDALFAQTSQAMFNVVTGRTSHEVVQVKSMVYPWGIRVVRTITLFRLGNGYVARIDSGWQSQSDGRFDFSYFVQATDPANNQVKVPKDNPFTFHPGIIHGLFNVRNIHEIPKSYPVSTQVNYGPWTVDAGGNLTSAKADITKTANLQAVLFDCDVELEHVVEGGSGNRVVSRGVIGYVQLAPPAAPIDITAFSKLMAFENESIGGEISCVIKVAGTEQRMKINRFDVNNSVDEIFNPVFVCSARGSVILPKEGSWNMVQHNRGSGEVTPLPEALGIPLVREGKWDKNTTVPVSATSTLVRLAYPMDLLKPPDPTTINFGFLQGMNTQKVLYLTPSFHPDKLKSLLSKTPPLLADAYRLMNSNAIFPSIGDGEINIGTAIQLLNGVNGLGNPQEAFNQALDKGAAAITEGGKKVMEILSVSVEEEAGKLLDQGYGLIAKKADSLFKFDLPAFSYPLIDTTGLKIYIEYKADHKKSNKPGDTDKSYTGKFDYDIDSKAADLAKTWKGRMNNLAMVVDLGPLKRLMVIKGNFNSEKGKEADYGSTADEMDADNIPRPEVEFSDDLKAAIYILELLGELSAGASGDYADLVKKGLKIAMSNAANLWEYKFEATKDLPLIKFPPGELYDSPQTPLKLEASMSLGFFFNAALKVTSDPKQLLPTAGAFFKFHGGLSVMCVSLAAATVYAVGEADLVLRADTSPMISLDLKFGFGAQIAVGLPVIGNVSILFMIGVEIYVDSTQKVAITAFMLFRGHAELLGGLVGVTITIEASGTVEKTGPKLPTNCKAQVTFALDISIFWVIDIDFSESWEETRQIA